jgi:hypothetical protein
MNKDILIMALDDAISYNLAKADKTKNIDKRFNMLQVVESFQDLKERLESETNQ